MSDKTDLIMQKLRDKQAKSQASQNSDNKKTAEFYGNIGVTIRNERDEEVFVSLGGIALDSLLKLSNGTAAVTRTRNKIVKEISTICSSLEEGETSLALNNEGFIYKFQLQIRKVGNSIVDESSFDDIDLTQILC